MQAYSSRSLVQVDQSCRQPEIGSVEGRRVPTGPCPYNNDVGIINKLQRQPCSFLQPTAEGGGFAMEYSNQSRAEVPAMRMWILA